MQHAGLSNLSVMPTGLPSLLAGITPGLVRISVGITGTLEQRMAQLLGAVQSST